MGRTDIVLRHVRYSEAPDFHIATRNFYGRALGTSAYGFLTILRHPVDRYISDFYYYTEPEARKAHRRLTLRQYAAKGEGANRMAREFAVKDTATALEFVAGEMHADGIFLILELLDYGLALLASHCGWRLSQLLYLPTNTNMRGAVRYGNITLSARPGIAQLFTEDPVLLKHIAAINGVDAVLYSAAYGQLMATLQSYGPAAATTSAVMATAVRLTAARRQLEADCRVLHGDNAAAAVASQDIGLASLAPPLTPLQNISANDLEGLCAWYSMLDSLYERMPNLETGRVDHRTMLPPTFTPSPSGPVGHLLRLADAYLAPYEDPSVPYYHSLLAVHVRHLTTAEAELVYGMSDDDGGGGDRQLAVLAAAVRLWTSHHTREGFHHLIFLVDALNDTRQEDLVHQEAAATLRQDAAATIGGAAAATADVASYTTFSILRCGAMPNAIMNNVACGAAAFHDTISRSRWFAVLPDLTYFMYGTRGTVRNVLLSYEGTLQAAGAVCAPLVPWRTPPPGATLVWTSGGAAAGGRTRRGGGSGAKDTALESSDNAGGEEELLEAEVDGFGGDDGAGGTLLQQQQQQRRRRRRRRLKEVSDDGDGGAAAASTAPPGCMRVPCTLGNVKEALHCIMVQAMPLLGLTQPYTSSGTLLPGDRSSYRVPYRGTEQQKLEVSKLAPPSEKDLQLLAEDPNEKFRCAKVRRPKLWFKWCNYER
ncbi:hypothetical protein Vretimale_11914 [Volvox reticuliferus]|nr:hypothetical protein Vretifemale_11460 [Volvox reticuliferus]GIM07857.1 hypothetical protein Vretimale_11914 [Volvox reticuliferus]